MLIKIFNKGYLMMTLKDKKELNDMTKEYNGYEYKIENDDGISEWGIITNTKAYKEKDVVLDLTEDKFKIKKETDGDGKKKI